MFKDIFLTSYDVFKCVRNNLTYTSCMEDSNNFGALLIYI